jgi:hypothetical protein
MAADFQLLLCTVAFSYYQYRLSCLYLANNLETETVKVLGCLASGSSKGYLHLERS